MSRRVTVALALGLGIPLLGACSDSNSPTGSRSAEARGLVVDASNNAPVAGALLRITPQDVETTTDNDGRFRFSGLSEGLTYTLVVEADAYSRVTTDFSLGNDEILEMVLELPPFERIPTPNHPMRVWTSIISGGIDEASITYSLEIENRGETEVTDLSIMDTLDSRLRYTLQEDDIVLNVDLFPETSVQIHDNGRAFTIDVGTLGSTGAPALVATFTIPSPENPATFCNFVFAEALLNSETIRETDNICQTTPVTN